MTLKEKLFEIDACEEAIEWVGDRTLEEVWNECHRGDWMLWLYRRSSNCDFQKLILAKGHCANTVRHLMRAVYAAYAGAAGAGKKAKEENQKLTADICRKYLPIPEI